MDIKFGKLKREEMKAAVEIASRAYQDYAYVALYYVGCECFSPFLGRVVSINNVFLSATEVALFGFPQLPVEVGFLVDVQWIGSG